MFDPPFNPAGLQFSPNVWDLIFNATMGEPVHLKKYRCSQFRMINIRVRIKSVKGLKGD